MPSFGLKQKLSVLGVAQRPWALSTSSASAANDVWLWACHGPGGEALGDAASAATISRRTATAATCAGDDLDAGGCARSPSAARDPRRRRAHRYRPAGHRARAVRICSAARRLPAGVTLRASRSARRRSSPSTGADVAAADKTFTTVPPAVPATRQLQLSCTARLPGAGPSSIDVGRVGLKVVDDPATPEAARRRRLPQPGSDTPRRSTPRQRRGRRPKSRPGAASRRSRRRARPVPELGNCNDLTPDDATVDLPLDATAAPTSTSVVLDVDTPGCPTAYGTRLVVASTTSPATSRRRCSTTEILNNVNLGTQRPDAEHRHERHDRRRAANNNADTNTGGVAGAQLAGLQDAAPLVLALAEAAARLQGRPGAAVRQALPLQRPPDAASSTASASPAPKRTRIDILNKIGKKTVSKAGTTVARQGQAHHHPRLQELAYADLPVHQLRQQAVAGEHQDQGRRRRSPKR